MSEDKRALLSIAGVFLVVSLLFMLSCEKSSEVFFSMLAVLGLPLFLIFVIKTK